MNKRIKMKKLRNLVLYLFAGPDKRAQRKARKEILELRKCKWFDHAMQERFRELGEQIRNAPILEFTTDNTPKPELSHKINKPEP